MSASEDLWSNLPVDILNIIIWRIPLVYHPHLACVCKHWNSACTHKLHRIKQTPLLIHLKKQDVFNYYSPSLNKTFMVQSPLTLSQFRFHSSKHGWLVLCNGSPEEEEVQVMLLNPATNVSYSYPRLTYSYLFTGITFSGCPGTENFVIFAITSNVQTNYRVSICLWKQEQWKLKMIGFDNSIPFSVSSYSSPVLCNGSFYCVSDNGRLGVFNPEKETWNVLTRPKGFSVPILDKREVYLIESRGGITAVVGGNHHPRVLIFCLDSEKMAWQQFTSMEPESFFIGPKASLAMDVSARAMRGRVYSSRFWGEVEVLQAEMEVCQGQLFFVTKALCGSKSKDGLRNGNIVSCSMQNHKMDKYFPSYEHLHYAWYNPQISFAQQVSSVGEK